jgi:DNA ligase 1
LVSSSKGLSLRFPRFMKVREDKSIEEASDTVFLAHLWRKQQGEKDLVEEGDELVDVDLRSSAGEESDDSVSDTLV